MLPYRMEATGFEPVFLHYYDHIFIQFTVVFKSSIVQTKSTIFNALTQSG